MEKTSSRVFPREFDDYFMTPVLENICEKLLSDNLDFEDGKLLHIKIFQEVSWSFTLQQGHNGRIGPTTFRKESLLLSFGKIFRIFYRAHLSDYFRFSFWQWHITHIEITHFWISLTFAVILIVSS